MIFSKNKAKEVCKMIEVIKHGLKKFKVTCTNCGCEFTYELSDMKPLGGICLLYTSPSPRDAGASRMPSSA